MLNDIRKMEAVHNHCGKSVREMVEETPDVILETVQEANNKFQLRNSLYAIIMSFITYLFVTEKIILKRKDSNGKE
jgi:hypothetical protein